MSTVRIVIDGKQIDADSDKTILQVCREQGINIPTLCYDDQLEPFTSCLLCVVEVEEFKNLVPSCGIKVQEGMRITTENENIREARKMALELILSDHYADCLGPCKLSCPAGVDVQGYLALAAMGKFREAIELIKRNNPLPTVCGRVCTRPCEMNCRRNFIDEPAAIDHVKRFIADIDLDSTNRYFPELKPDTEYKVAIIGAGPAGLSCAYYLRQEGHSIDIFDAKPKAGGMLRWGIPQYRLPEEIIDKEIEGITKLGVNIFLNKALGRDFSIDDLFQQGYKSIFLGLGAQASTSMRVDNENAEGVLSGIDFLEDIKLKKINELKGKIAVIGGGNTAMDAARSALRLGADEVTIVYRRTIQEMPANKIEIEEAEEEGIKFKFLTAPVKVILNKSKRAIGIECVQMELGTPDSSGRRRPIPIEGSNFIINVNWIIAAIGQKPDLEFAGKDNKLVNISQTKWGTLEVRPEVMSTNIPGIFAGGDVVLGAATAIEAIADGRKAAEAIHKYLTGEKLKIPKKPFISRKDNFKKLSDQDFIEIEKTTRAKMAVRDPQKRIADWDEIELGFTVDQVFNEALRCLECGCQAFYDCELQIHSTEYEVVQENYHGEFHDNRKDSSHPFIEIDLNKCILCGRCIRICDEIMGLGIYGFVKRGFDTKVKPVLELPLAETNCISCGQCVETCPTGAIIDKVDATKPGPWVLEKKSSICQYCSIGCNLNVNILEDRVLKISADKNAKVNEHGNLCQKGRYGFRYVNDEKRLKQPLIRKNGQLQPISWDEAFDFTVKKIQNLQKKKVNWAIFGSPHSTNEENYVLQKFARAVLHTNNINSFSNLNELPENLLKGSMSNTTFDKIKRSDFIIVSNFDPMETHPILYIELQKAVRKKKTVYLWGSSESRLAKKSKSLNIPENKIDLFLKYLLDKILQSNIYEKTFGITKKNEMRDVFTNINKISQRISLSDFNIIENEFNLFLKTLVNAVEPIFICHKDTTSPEIFHWLGCLEYVLGKKESLLSLPSSINFQGMLDMGIIPNYLPGYQRIDDPDAIQRISALWDCSIPTEAGMSAWKSYQEYLEGKVKGLLIWNQDPLGAANLPISRLDNSFIVVSDMFLTKTAQIADVVFPLVPFTETSGTITNAESRIQKFQQVIKPVTKFNNWAILQHLSSKLGYSMTYKSSDEIFEEISLTVPAYRKEIALLRDGYTPDHSIINNLVIKNIPFGANFLEKWFESFIQENSQQPENNTVQSIFQKETST